MNRWYLLLALPLTAYAGGAKPEAGITWLSPTCDDATLEAEATLRATSVCGEAGVAATVYQYQDARGPVAGCRVFVHAWCNAREKVAYQPPGRVVVPTMYTDKDFKGRALALTASPVDLMTLPNRLSGDWNKKAGSVRVPEGWTVRLCDEPDGGGRCTDLTQDTTDLGRTLVKNDKARWVEVTQGTLPPLLACPRAFEHDGYGGKHLDLCQDMVTLRSGSWNNKINSVLVPEGWQVEVCDGEAGVPPCTILAADVPKLNDTAVRSDKITSVKVVARP